MSVTAQGTKRTEKCFVQVITIAKTNIMVIVFTNFDGAGRKEAPCCLLH
jgi:hypothetical protein